MKLRLADFCLRPKAFWADAEAHAKEEVETGTVAVGQELNFLAPSTLTQWYCIVPGKERLAALFAAILSRVGERKSIVFFSTGASVDFHCDLLQDAAWPSRSGGRKKREDGAQPAIKKLQGRFVGLAKDAKLLQKEDEDEEEEEEEEAAEDLRRQNEEKMFAKTKIFKLHGSLSKEERAGYIRDFLQIPGGVLLASDAASRGLDFPQIDWIIQYDPPQRTRCVLALFVEYVCFSMPQYAAGPRSICTALVAQPASASREALCSSCSPVSLASWTSSEAETSRTSGRCSSRSDDQGTAPPAVWGMSGVFRDLVSLGLLVVMVLVVAVVFVGIIYAGMF